MNGPIKRVGDRLRSEFLESGRLLHKSGVPLTTGSNMINSRVIPGDSRDPQMGLLVEAGIPASAVFQISDEDAAHTLGLNDMGIVEEGRRYDPFYRALPATQLRRRCLI